MVYLYFLLFSVISYQVGQFYIKNTLNKQYLDPKISKHQSRSLGFSTIGHNLKNLKNSSVELLISLLDVLEKISLVIGRLRDIIIVTYLWFLIPMFFDKGVKKYNSKNEK